jgi:hypothetical protein
MADKKAKSDVKSGVGSKDFATNTLGGYPASKDLKEINKANTPGKAPGSVRA